MELKILEPGKVEMVYTTFEKSAPGAAIVRERKIPMALARVAVIDGVVYISYFDSLAEETVRAWDL